MPCADIDSCGKFHNMQVIWLWLVYSCFTKYRRYNFYCNLFMWINAKFNTCNYTPTWFWNSVVLKMCDSKTTTWIFGERKSKKNLCMSLRKTSVDIRVNIHGLFLVAFPYNLFCFFKKYSAPVTKNMDTCVALQSCDIYVLTIYQNIKNPRQ